MNFQDYAKGYRAGTIQSIEAMYTVGAISRETADCMIREVPNVVNEALKAVIDTIRLEDTYGVPRDRDIN